jgi:hypothetical protein
LPKQAQDVSNAFTVKMIDAMRKKKVLCGERMVLHVHFTGYSVKVRPGLVFEVWLMISILKDFHMIVLLAVFVGFLLLT